MMNSNKKACYLLTSLLCLSFSSAFTLNVHSVPLSTSLTKKTVNNYELRAIFGGDGFSSDKNNDDGKEKELEIDDESSGNDNKSSSSSNSGFAEPKKYTNLANGKETDAKLRDAYSKANSELSMTWGWFFLLYPLVLFLNDAFHFLPGSYK